MFASPLLADALTFAVSDTGKSPSPCGDRAPVKEFVIRVHDEHAPAFRSAIEEIAEEIAGRLEGMHSFAQEQALTDALVPIHNLRAQVFQTVAAGDPHYKKRRR